jgi:DtxR family transcriptional regulator, Mn-dependent transcriptional regulator
MSRIDSHTENTVSEPSKTIEDYLLNIYTLSSEGRTVIAARLAEALEVAPPTVTATLHRMARDGLIIMGPQKEVGLTEAGQMMAETMVRRHRLAERLLIDILGLDWADVHEEAHRFEHAISPRVEERILAVLGDPTTCPHGSPIPGTGAVYSSEAFRVESASAGDHVVIERISEDAENDRELLSFFQRSGLLPGREFDVGDVEPYNSLIMLRHDGDSIPVSLPVAHKIWVRRAR